MPFTLTAKQAIMPFLKLPKERDPLWKAWDHAAQKKGLRHTVYSVNGNEYTGEWLDNKKDGTLLVYCHLAVIIPIFNVLIDFSHRVYFCMVQSLLLSMPFTCIFSIYILR